MLATDKRAFHTKIRKVIPLRSDRVDVPLRVLLIVWAIKVSILPQSDAMTLPETVEDFSIAEATPHGSEGPPAQRWAASIGWIDAFSPAASRPGPDRFHAAVRRSRRPSAASVNRMNPAFMAGRMMAPYESLLNIHGSSILALWLFGLGVIGATGRRLRRKTRGQDRTTALLSGLPSDYRALIDNSMTGIYISQDNTIKFANARFAEIHEFHPCEIIGMDSLSLVLPEDRQVAPDILGRNLRKEGFQEEYEIRCITKSGKVIWVQRRNTVIDHDGRAAILGNEIEITARKNAEIELKASEELLKRLSWQLLRFQDAERSAMAREFNENIAQCLSAVKLRTEALLQPGTGNAPSIVSGQLQQIIDDLETTVAVVREMTKRLSPLMVEDIGVLPAIQWLCRKLILKAPKLRIRTDIRAAESAIPDWLKTDIFRVLEKILWSAVAQGRTNRVKISLQPFAGSLKLKIVDDDKDCSPQNPLEDRSERGVDFVAVRSRVEARGGWVRWECRPGSGHNMALIWPLKGV